MRQVQQLMGMPISIEIDSCSDQEVFDAAYNRLARIDKKYSLYKSDSEAAQYASGKLTEDSLSAELREVIRQCRTAETLSDGFFSAWADGNFDPSGYVKGWAIAEAGSVIEKRRHHSYCISAGGDVLARSDSNKTWNIGIQDPVEPCRVLKVLKIKNGAVATSGNYERGKHITNPKTKQLADKLLSASVIGPDIIMADILATAIFASELSSPNFLKSHKDYQALIISR